MTNKHTVTADDNVVALAIDGIDFVHLFDRQYTLTQLE